jgi:acetylglutamate kinase
MVTVVKISGNVIDNPVFLQAFLRDFALLPGPKVLVHGGGKLATQLAERLDVPQTMVEGRRITDAETLKIAVMSYAGWINKNVVAGLQAQGCNAMGFCGADGNMLRAVKRPVASIDYGWVGDIVPENVHIQLISQLFELGITPVFSAITHDGAGQLLNTNADTIAAVTAIAISRVRPCRLLLCFEKKGVLRDVENPESLISVIRSEEWAALKASGVVHSGMLPKLDNAFAAIVQGVQSVSIMHAADLVAVANGGNAGTILMA